MAVSVMDRVKIYSRAWGLLIAVALLSMLPATAAAQSVIAGVVKDGTGAVLPGVTVEASSSALIEKAAARPPTHGSVQDC